MKQLPLIGTALRNCFIKHSFMSKYWDVTFFMPTSVSSKMLFGLVWFVGFYGISIVVGYLTSNPFYVNNLFYLKQFSLA